MSNKKMWGIVTNPWRAFRRWFLDYGFRQVTMSPTHAMIHLGGYYVAFMLYQDVTSGGSRATLIRTGSIQVHATFMFATGADAIAYMYENPTLDTLGAEVIPVNHKRYGDIASSESTTFKDVTYTDPGTALIPGQFLPGGDKSNFSLGSVSPALREEWILNPNTDYLIEVENQGSNAENLECSIGFYETDTYM